MHFPSPGLSPFKKKKKKSLFSAFQFCERLKREQKNSHSVRPVI